MTRLLLVAALLVAGVAPAWAQSDNRKLAIFYTTGSASGGDGQARTTGNPSGHPAGEASEANAIVRTCLDRMGVPYTIFSVKDSAGGWARAMGSTRPAGMADSTWFRQNGYFGTMFFWNEIASGTNQTFEPVRYFSNGVNSKGTQAHSPIDGTWGIPALIYYYASKTNAAVPWSNGINGFVFGSGTALQRKSFGAGGDSLAWLTAAAMVRSPAEAANVTPIIVAGDTLDATGTQVSAWTYKTNAEYWHYPIYTRPQSALLGLASLFRRAGYVPRRKLNLHWTLDHIFAVSPTTPALTDSFFAYVEKMDLRFSGQVKSHGLERDLTTVEISNKYQTNNRKARFPGVPHSHITGIGNWSSGATWDFTAYADTAFLRESWNGNERAISDTMGLVVAKGYERTVGFPLDGYHYPHLSIMAKAKYTDVRAANSDSTGNVASKTAFRAVYFAASTLTNRNGNLPRSRLITLGMGNSPYNIYIHPQWSHPGGTAKTWAAVAYDITDGVDGKASNNLNNMCQAIIWDGDFYWHPNENLEGADEFILTFMRRFQYFYSRVDNIVTVGPSYRTKFPRKPGTARTY